MSYVRISEKSKVSEKEIRRHTSTCRTSEWVSLANGGKKRVCGAFEFVMKPQSYQQAIKPLTQICAYNHHCRNGYSRDVQLLHLCTVYVRVRVYVYGWVDANQNFERESGIVAVEGRILLYSRIVSSYWKQQVILIQYSIFYSQKAVVKLIRQFIPFGMNGKKAQI